MPKNIHGGSRHKRSKNKPVEEKKENIIEASDEQIYGIVKKKLGGNHILILCSDGEQRNALIPGKMYKKVWLKEDDIVMCDIDINGACMINTKYNPREVELLKSKKMLTKLLGQESDEDENIIMEEEVISKNKIEYNQIYNNLSESSHDSSNSNDEESSEGESDEESSDGDYGYKGNNKNNSGTDTEDLESDEDIDIDDL